MKQITLLMFMALFLLPGQTNCDDQRADFRSDPGKYKDAGKEIYVDIKGIGLEDKSGVEKAKEIVDAAAGIATTVNFIPGAQAITTPLVAGLGAISAILTYFTVKKTKEIKVITEDRDKHEKRSNNYREVINDGIVEGGDPDIIDVTTLSSGMDKDTKAHFNEEGKAKIQ